MSDNNSEVIILIFPDGKVSNSEVHTEATALERLRQLTYEGALPGTYTERWYSTNVGWELDDDVWRNSE